MSHPIVPGAKVLTWIYLGVGFSRGLIEICVSHFRLSN